MAVPPRCSLVTLGVADVARSTAFYEALGWERSPASVDGVVSFFDLAGAILSLYDVSSLAADAHQPVPDAPSTPPFRAVSLACNVDRADEVARALDEVERAGGTVVAPATETDWGGVIGSFTDPDGHLWEVAWNPGFPIGPDGRPQLPTPS